MGNSPSQPSLVNGAQPSESQFTIIGNTNPCGGSMLLLPVTVEQFSAVGMMPCTQQEYQAILQLAAPLGEGQHCQSAWSKPQLGDEVCQRLNAQIPSCAFHVTTVWTVDCCVGKYWEHS